MLNRCEIGDCREVLRRMIAEGVKVQMCVTSPPYWGLRDYGTAVWEGGDAVCGHVAQAKPPVIGSSSTLGFPSDGGQRRIGEGNNYHEAYTAQYRHTCAKCGARRVDAQIGLERTPEEFVQQMVEVFRLVREVLADDGTLWLNLGDSYVAAQGGPQSKRGVLPTTTKYTLGKPRVRPGLEHMTSWASRAVTAKVIPTAASGLKPKDLCGMPWRVAFALQADGWYLRSDIIWHKPNPMPESCEDRPTKSHEYLFLLTKGPRYFYDAEAVKEEAAYGYSSKPAMFDRIGDAVSQPERTGGRTSGGKDGAGGTRNRRTVWTIPSEAFPESHFATFPRKLVEPCILAGTSERGHCHECGKRWERVVEREKPPEEAFNKAWFVPDGNVKMSPLHRSGKASGQKMQDWLDAHPATTTGWRPTCAHNLEPVPDIVLDPFLGSGTVAQCAQHLGRSWLGIDLNPTYSPMQQRRTAQTALVLAS
jgi:DNA modification methylase